jgi:hypothetical protein
MKKIKFILSISCLLFSTYDVAYAYEEQPVPVSQETFIALGVTDPNTWVKSNSQVYNLKWGALDENGGKYAVENAGTKRVFKKPLSYYGKTITSANDSTKGPTIYTPNAEVRTAWIEGWTGKGVNILNIDFYPSEYGPTYGIDDEYHGIKTMMLIDQIAPGASKYGLNYKDIIQWQGCTSNADCTISIASAKDINGKNIKNNDVGKKINVINMSSFGTYFNAHEHMMEDAYVIANLLNDNVAGIGVNLSKAVIVSAAENNTYFYDKNIYSRLLMVGATKSDGTPSNKTELLPNSNTAENNSMIADRFVVANGSAPYAVGDAMVNGVNSDNSSTNYATARVTAMVAILRQKFPDLSAEQASNIILDRARTDTIVNYQPNIHGKGEVSLSRALAPVGNLR